MKRFLTDRVDRFGALGQAAADLVRAESAALQSALELNVRRLVGVLALFGVALFALFWALGALIFSLVELGTTWMPRWVSALAMVALLAMLVLVLVAVARRRLRRLETPAATLRRRVEDYREWWERRIEGGAGRGAGQRAAGGEASGGEEISRSPGA